ncbi:hypothetical protein DFH09DRAFT_1105493 [Mycena vulgaris]|nr:hypothetical protein DFH09DRAFT_1105493 [Mycena vulgaris]
MKRPLGSSLFGPLFSFLFSILCLGFHASAERRVGVSLRILSECIIASNIRSNMGIEKVNILGEHVGSMSRVRDRGKQRSLAARCLTSTSFFAFPGHAVRRSSRSAPKLAYGLHRAERLRNCRLGYCYRGSSSTVLSAPSLLDLLNDDNIAPQDVDRKALEKALFEQPDPHDLDETDRVEQGCHPCFG